ncbi:hypothetical protein [Nocardioides sp. URHA0032]|uniref:hypothetical protein n=1 Tax=Nocardioides sp. URHA0032 TaxID=1380388 RepID=UPI00048BA6A9|nr:hypothetical protein [Nocardioides sp. URHA0032]
MNQMQPTLDPTLDAVATDVFDAARWLDSQSNSSAKAVAPDEIEWQCNMWGSGRGRGYEDDAAIFYVIIAAFDLRTWCNKEGREELVVAVPLDRFARIAQMIDRLDQDEPGSWPWADEDSEDPIADAAEYLEMSPSELLGNAPLLEALGLRES